MIRIDLQPRTARFRWVGIILGLTVATGALGGAIYTLDQRMPLLRIWARLQAPAAETPVALEVAAEDSSQLPRPAPTAPVSLSNHERPSTSDVAARAARLLAHLPDGYVVSLLLADDSGSVVIEGELHSGVTLTDIAASLQGLVEQVRVTRWSSDSQTGVGGCRVSGRVAAGSGAPLPIVAAADLAAILGQVLALTGASGIQAARLDGPRAGAQGHEYTVHEVDVQGLASAQQAEVLLHSLQDLPVRIRQLAMAGGTAVRPAWLTLSLDAVVGADVDFRQQSGGATR